jgi:hypothetical protein
MPPVRAIDRQESVDLPNGTPSNPATPDGSLSFTIRPEKVLRVLGVVIAVLLVGHVLVGIAKHVFGVTYLFGLLAMFNLIQENNAPTLYTCVMLLVCSALLALLTCSAWASKRGYVAHWGILSATFVYLCYDEFAQLHEKVSVYFEELNLVQPVGALKYLWVIPYGIAAILFGLAYIPFLLHLPRPIGRLFVASGAAYIMGAVVFEMVAGAGGRLHLGGLVVGVIVPMLEEGFEMAGLALFIYSILRYVQDYVGPLQLTVPTRQG